MYGGSAIDLLERAEQLARDLGREREAADFLFSRWAAHAQGIELRPQRPAGPPAARAGRGSADPIVRAYGRQAWGIHQWDIGNIGEAYRYLSQSERTLHRPTWPARRGPAPARSAAAHDRACSRETTALHGDVDAARALLDTLEAAAGDDPYAITVWATFAARIAAVVGDPALGATRGGARDRRRPRVLVRLPRHLPAAGPVLGAGRDRRRPCGGRRRGRADHRREPARPATLGVATWYGLLGEMWLAAGSTGEAAAALDRADSPRHLRPALPRGSAPPAAGAAAAGPRRARRGRPGRRRKSPRAVRPSARRTCSSAGPKSS